MENKERSHRLKLQAAIAEKNIQKGEYQKAILKYTEIINDPIFATLEEEVQEECFLNRGIAFRETGNLTKTIADFTQASYLLPKSYKPHVNLGLVYAENLKQYEQALAEFDQAICLNPTDVSAYTSRGLTKALMGNWSEAEADYQTAMELEPDNANAQLNLGCFYAQHLQFDKAIALFQKILEKNPKDIEARNNLNLAQMLTGQKNATPVNIPKNEAPVSQTRRPENRVKKLQPLLFFIGYLSSAYLVAGFSGRILGLHWEKSWYLLDKSLDTMKLILKLGPGIGMLFGIIIASGTAISIPGIRKKPLQLFGSNVISFGLGNMIFYSLSFLWIGNEKVALWAKAVGEWGLRTHLFLVIPGVGVLIGSLLSLMALRQKNLNLQERSLLNSFTKAKDIYYSYAYNLHKQFHELNDLDFHKAQLSNELNEAARIFRSTIEVLKASESTEATKNDLGVALYQLGMLLHIQGNFAEATLVLNESISYFQQLMPNENRMRSLSGCYYHLGLILERNHKIDEALKYYQQSLLIDQELHDQDGVESTNKDIERCKRYSG